MKTMPEGEFLKDSKEFLDCIYESKRNETECILQKNLWVMLRMGKEMDSKSISKGLKSVREGLHNPNNEKVSVEHISSKIQFDINTSNTENPFKLFWVKPSHSLVYNKTSGKICESIISEGFCNYWIN
jgi:hypothetical protein